MVQVTVLDQEEFAPGASSEKVTCARQGNLVIERADGKSTSGSEKGKVTSLREQSASLSHPNQLCSSLTSCTSQ